MKVLKIIHTTGHGGAENIFRWLSADLSQRGVEVILAIPAPHESTSGEYWIGPAIEEMNLPSIRFNNNGSMFRLYNNLYSIIKKVSPDLVHSHLLDSNFYSSLASRRLSVPHICTEHGDIIFKRDIKSILKFSSTCIASNTVVCVSNNLKAQAAKLSLLPHKFQLVYNGIQFPKKAVASLRSEFGISDDTIVIGHVGNLYPIKGQKYLLDAFRLFHRIYQNSCLIIVGRGKEKISLCKRILELKIPKNKIFFTGFRSDVNNLLNTFDVYVQPSLSEGFPVALLEALSLDIPVIASSVGGIPEIIGHNERGYLVTPGQSDEIFAALKQIMSNRKQAVHKAQIGGTFVRENFSISRMSKEYNKIYKSLTI